MTKKRFKSENIKFSSFIVDLDSARSRGTNITKYITYDTNTKKKCDELTDLLNELFNENDELSESNHWLIQQNIKGNSKIMEMSIQIDELEKENERLKIKLERERNSFTKQHLKWDKEANERIKELEKENAQLTIKLKAMEQIKPQRKIPEAFIIEWGDDDSK